jgi:cobalt-zinc-cadmium resistance protein CzcA
VLDKIIKFSIKNKIVIGIMTLLLIIWGVWSASRLPIDAVPDITNNQVQIVTVSPSSGAEDIERFVTFPVEQSMATTPGIEEIRSFSRFGLSVVTIVFTEETDIYWARQQVAERFNNVAADLPGGVFTCDSTDTPEGAIECASSSSMLFSDDVFADDCSASSAN